MTGVKTVTAPQPVRLDVRDAGAMVRVGRAHDGGYVLPSLLVERATVLLSFGISNDWSFEADFLARNPHVRLHGFDASVGPWYFAKRALRSYVAAGGHGLAGKGSRRERSLARAHASRDYFSFFRGRAHHHCHFIRGSATGGTGVTLAEAFALADVQASDRVLLKIDIEGAEYDVVPDIGALASRIDGIAFEFHETQRRRAEFNAAMAALAPAFDLVHVHGNNYEGVDAEGFPDAPELTFLSRALAGAAPPLPAGTLPRPGLDYPNDPAKADIPLGWIGRPGKHTA